MLRPETYALTALLALLGGLPAFSMDIYLPSMPDIVRSLGTTDAVVQMTISSYMIAAATGMVVFGPIADRFGRRPVLIAALLIYCAGNVVCALAPSVEVLLVGRALQALGPAGTTVLARAIVRDLYEGTRMGRELSVMAATMGFMPLAAPLIGGSVQTLYGWRAVFVVLLGVGLVAGLVVWLKLPETVRVRAPAISIGGTFRVFGSLLVHPAYRAYVAIIATTSAGLTAWLVSAPFILQSTYGLTPFAFSVIFVIPTTAYLVGAAAASRVVMRIGIDRTIGCGAAAVACAGLVMISGVVFDFGGAATPIAAMSLYLGGIGFVFPQSLAGAMSPFHDRAGSASSLAALIQQSLGSLVGVFVGLVIGPQPLLVAIAISAAGLLAFILWATTRRIRREQARALVREHTERP